MFQGKPPGVARFALRDAAVGALRGNLPKTDRFVDTTDGIEWRSILVDMVHFARR